MSLLASYVMINEGRTPQFLSRSHIHIQCVIVSSVSFLGTVGQNVTPLDSSSSKKFPPEMYWGLVCNEKAISATPSSKSVLRADHAQRAFAYLVTIRACSRLGYGSLRRPAVAFGAAAVTVARFVFSALAPSWAAAPAILRSRRPKNKPTTRAAGRSRVCLRGEAVVWGLSDLVVDRGGC